MTATLTKTYRLPGETREEWIARLAKTAKANREILAEQEKAARLNRTMNKVLEDAAEKKAATEMTDDERKSFYDGIAAAEAEIAERRNRS
jgi:hypothetical protein